MSPIKADCKSETPSSMEISSTSSLLYKIYFFLINFSEKWGNLLGVLGNILFSRTVSGAKNAP